MTREDIDFIGAMNMCDEISNEAYKKIMVHCEEEQPCTDSISRQAVIDATTKYCVLYDLRELLADIETLPSINVAEKTGRWIYDRNNDDDGCEPYYCSECGTYSDDYPYCCGCGAKMEVEE